MTHDEMIDVIRAHRDGKQIQYKHEWSGEWSDALNPPCWAFNKCDYRVKPEPREWWIINGNAYANKNKAAMDFPWIKDAPIHVREVL